jgi:hypothetical protein
METIIWDNIDQDYLEIIYSIYATFVNIENEKEKIRQIYLILFLRYYLNTEFIKEHIKAYYFLENIQYLNIIDEVFNNIIHVNLSINENEDDQVYEDEDDQVHEDEDDQVYEDEDDQVHEDEDDQVHDHEPVQETVTVTEIQIEYFINFLNNLEDVKIVLNENDLNEIPEKQYSEISTEFNTCSICQDELSKDNIIRQLNCSHIYHKECIDKYLLEYSSKCPICRAECRKKS